MLIFRKSVRSLIPAVVVMSLLLSAIAVQPASALVSPTVLSVTRADADPTAAGTVHFTVTFSAPVNNVDDTDFGLAVGSIADADIVAFTGTPGDSAYTVAVTTGTGLGTIGLDVEDGTDIVAAEDGSPLVSGFTAGDVYTVQNPTVISVTRVTESPSSLPNVEFLVTFSVPVDGVNTGTTSDFSLTVSGVVGAKVKTLAGTAPSATYTVTVGTGSGNGKIRLNVRDNDSIRGPDSGRQLGGPGTGNGAFTTGETYTIIKVPTAKSPAGTFWDMTPKLTWSLVPRATKYQYQMYKGTTLLYTGTLLATSCTLTCSKTTSYVLLPGPYSWHVRAYIDGGWKPYSPLKIFTVYAPRAGHWGQHTPSSVAEFYVTPDRSKVNKFTYFFWVPTPTYYCYGWWYIYATIKLPISSTGKFAFDHTTFFGRGAFAPSALDATTATGKAGIRSLSVSGCGTFTSSGAWSLNWADGSQPSAASLDLGDQSAAGLDLSTPIHVLKLIFLPSEDLLNPLQP